MTIALRTLGVAATAVALALGEGRAAEAPLQFSQHGRLLGEADQPVTGLVVMTVSIHRKDEESTSDYAANLVWKCRHENVQVTNGFYSLLVGSGEKPGQPGAPCDPLEAALFDGSEERWMTVAINGDPEMEPRLQIGYVPWALRALHAADADSLGNHAPGYYVARSQLDASGGTVNDASNPMDWSRLKGVPAAFADGTDDGASYQSGAGLDLNSGTGAFSIAAGGVTNGMLANDAASLQKVSGGSMAVSAGNVGVGTATPAYKLDVAGTVNATEILKNGAPLSTSQWTTSGTSIHYGNGNVGIGTTAPNTRLHVVGGGIRLEQSDFADIVWRGSGQTADNKLWSFQQNGLQFHGRVVDDAEGSAARWVSVTRSGASITSTVFPNGNVGIATATPTAKLHIGGTPGTDGIRFPDGTLQTTAFGGVSHSRSGLDFVSASGKSATFGAGSLFFSDLGSVVNRTSDFTIDLGSSANYLAGSSAADHWVYVVVSAAGVAKLTTENPSASDTAGTAAGKLRYRVYGSTPYRYLRALRTDSSGDIVLMSVGPGGSVLWTNSYNYITDGTATTYSSVSLASRVPPTSTRAILGIKQRNGADGTSNYLRPTGSGATGTFFPCTSVAYWTQMLLDTSVSQSIDYKLNNGYVWIDVNGYVDTSLN